MSTAREDAPGHQNEQWLLRPDGFLLLHRLMGKPFQARGTPMTLEAPQETRGTPHETGGTPMRLEAPLRKRQFFAFTPLLTTERQHHHFSAAESSERLQQDSRYLTLWTPL